MKNKLIDLNNHLFAQMERLSNEDLKNDEMDKEIKRSKAVSSLAVQIINNARLALDANTAIQQNLIRNPPIMLGAEGYED